jgi:hypothetical protein
MNGATPPTNGHDHGRPPTNGDGGETYDTPAAVQELAEACIRYVEAVCKVKLDYLPDTLSLLDHYVRSRRDEVKELPETGGLLARVIGAYFGEVLHRKFPSFWHLPSDDAAEWQLRLEPVYLALYPYEIAYDAMTLGDNGDPTARLELEEEDREAVEARLSELPAASDDEFFSLTTRLEVIEIAVDAIKARMMSAGLGDVAFSPKDYDED